MRSRHAMTVGDPLDWAHVKLYLQPACQGAIDYVSDITAGIPIAPLLSELITQADMTVTPTAAP